MPPTTVGALEIHPGHIVQVVRVQTGTKADGTFTVITETTIPTTSRGIACAPLNTVITPKSSTNILLVRAVIMLGNSVGSNYATVAMFLDAETDARAASTKSGIISGVLESVPFQYSMVAGSTSAKTFSFRIGTNNGGTIHLNSSNGVNNFVGRTLSTVTVFEIKA